DRHELWGPTWRTFGLATPAQRDRAVEHRQLEVGPALLWRNIAAEGFAGFGGDVHRASPVGLKRPSEPSIAPARRPLCSRPSATACYKQPNGRDWAVDPRRSGGRAATSRASRTA